MATRYVDLTVPWGPGVQPLEGHPGISFEPITTHAVDRRSNTRVVFSIHTGTHIDAPYHFFPQGKTIDQMPLHIFVGPAILLDLTQFGGPRQCITVDDVRSTGVTPAELAGRRAVLRTDWATHHWNQPDLYTGNPYLSEDAATWFRDAEVVALGLDFAVDAEFPYPNHYILLGEDILLIENLIHLDQVRSKAFTLMALPLKVVGGDGGPARALAQIACEEGVAPERGA